MHKTFLLFVISGLVGVGVGFWIFQWNAAEPENRISQTTELIESVESSEAAEEESLEEKTYPLYLATMTHMEGNFFDDKDEDVFNLHVEQIRYGMDLADDYGAKLTIESEKPFSRANSLWGLNILQEILDRGHGVGTHCDIGFRDDLASFDAYVEALKENKALVDELVGAENNLGCSGAGGENDWVKGMTEAGFSYIDGVVGMHYLPMSMENRPDSSWTDKFIYSKGFHDHAPVDLEDRIHLIRLEDAENFEADDDGTLVMSAGSIGRIDLMEEEIVGGDCKTCAFTNEDVDLVIEKIREAIEVHDPSKIAKVDVYFPVNIWDEANEAQLRYFFEQVAQLEQEGLVEWATQKEVYEAFTSWENS